MRTKQTTSGCQIDAAGSAAALLSPWSPAFCTQLQQGADLRQGLLFIIVGWDTVRILQDDQVLQSLHTNNHNTGDLGDDHYA